MNIAMDAPTVAEGGPDAVSTPWLATMLATLRARLWWVALAVAVCVIAAVVWLRTTEYRYTAAMRVAAAPTSARESSSIGALTTLATLTGGSVEAIPVTPFRLYVEGIYTREVAARLATDQRLLRRAFPEEWDAAGRRWRPPEGLGITVSQDVAAIAAAPALVWTPPDAARLQAFIHTYVGVDQTPKTPVVTISMVSVDREFARIFLARLHATTDAWLRERTLARTASNIEYIEQRLPTVTLADHRQALFATLSDQQQRQMMARNPASYAADRFGPPVVSDVPTSPRQVLMLAVAVVFGAVIGVVAAVVVPRRRRGA